MESATSDQLVDQADSFGALKNGDPTDGVWDWRITANHNEIVVTDEM